MKTGKDWRKIGAVRVQRAYKAPETFSSFEEAVRRIGWAQISLCSRGFIGVAETTLTGRTWYWGDPVVFYDELGLVIPVWRVKEEARRLGLDRPSRYWRVRRFTYRRGPVEGIRCWRGGRGHGDRAMRTTAENRENEFLDHFDEEAAEYAITPRRSRMKLPTWYDDVPCGRCPTRSWKSYRHHQWR